PALHAGGQGFDSLYLHQKNSLIWTVFFSLKISFKLRNIINKMLKMLTKFEYERRATLSLYRIKQFYRSLVAKINDKDVDFLKIHLKNYELKLFNQLPKYEQKHCINVARDVEIKCTQKKIQSFELIKVALLHDIGKIYSTMNPIDKSIMVVLNKITNGKIRVYNKFKNVNIYYNHGEIGYEILKQYGYDDRFLFLVKNHHNNIMDDIELNILKECDDKN
ncbi:HD domain-containing protein, partial [Clostridium sp.]